MEKFNLKKACERIELLLFDCDGVLTDGRIVLGSGKEEMKFFSTKDGMGIEIWHRAGFTCGCVSGRFSEALERRAMELKFEELHQKVSDKSQILSEISLKRKLVQENIAYIGDDLNDLAVRKRVGILFATCDAHRDFKSYADYVLETAGGKGAVREAIDLILRKKGVLEALIAKFLNK